MTKTKLIATPGKGYGDSLEVAGKTGKFNWDVEPRYIKGVGGGKSPLYQFESDDGKKFFYRLEDDKQGGRWEYGDYSEIEYRQIMQRPEEAFRMWGQTPLAQFLVMAASNRMPFEYIKPVLSEYDTWRQISGD